MFDTALVIVARAPQKGKTKTRLAATIGPTATLSLYQAFLTDLAQRFIEQPYQLHWTYTPAEVDFCAIIEQLVPGLPAGNAFPQVGDDLGSRLHHAFRTTHEHGFQKTILIGSDTPHITTEIITQAEQALEQSDIVLGPSEDGGYYLIAMRAPYDLFSEIPMSTPYVFQMTMRRAAQLGMTVHLLETLLDVDDGPALAQLMDKLQACPMLAPATSACLTTLNLTPKELL